MNSAVMRDAATATAKTDSHIRVSETLCKTILSLYLLKQDWKEEKKSNRKRANSSGRGGPLSCSRTLNLFSASGPQWARQLTFYRRSC